MSKISRQDFQLIAATIASMDYKTRAGTTDERAREYVALAFADALAATNPAFNRALFIQAATGVVAVTARKAKPRTLASDLAEDR